MVRLFHHYKFFDESLKDHLKIYFNILKIIFFDTFYLEIIIFFFSKVFE